MTQTSSLFRSAFILTLAGFLSRFLGFFYRIFLSRTFGEESIGLYQLIFPVYALCFSVTVSGIETAISRTVARKLSLHKPNEAQGILLTGLFFTTALSLLCSLFLQTHANYISTVFLHEKRCCQLLILLSYTFPFAAVHSCITGYCYGKKKTFIPASCQLLEQFVRICSVFIIYSITQKQHLHANISIAVIGLVIGEGASALYTLFYYLIIIRTPIVRKSMFLRFKKYSHEIWSFSLPISTNRILVNLLQSIEAISIPNQLCLFQLSSSEALRTYGVLTGMALPCILFPSAITNAVSVILMPTVAELQAVEKHDQLSSIIKKVFFYCLLLGLICCFGFLITGHWIGNALFHSSTAGNFIVTLSWICPFLFTGSTFLSVINGLGKTTYSLIINVIGLCIRIVSVFFFIPIYGIQGYLWGLLLSQLAVGSISLFVMAKLIS